MHIEGAYMCTSLQSYFKNENKSLFSVTECVSACGPGDFSHGRMHFPLCEPAATPEVSKASNSSTESFQGAHICASRCWAFSYWGKGNLKIPVRKTRVFSSTGVAKLGNLACSLRAEERGGEKLLSDTFNNLIT